MINNPQSGEKPAEQIVQLDVNDDVASTLAKLQLLVPGRSALVVPETNRALRGPIAMRVLRRQAGDSALDLAVISESPAIRHAASQAGFTVYGSIQSYQRALQRKPTGRRRRRESLAAAGRSASLFATVSVIVALTFVAAASVYLLLPQTKVVLTPVTQQVNEKLEIVADPESKTINLDKRVVPARVVYVQSQGAEQVQVTGKKESDNAKAEGRVTFTNRTDKEVSVPKGSIVRTPSDVAFVTNEDVKVPAGAQGVGRSTITAVEPGTKGNVERGQINKIDGGLDTQVSVFNEEATTGGGSKEMEVVTEEDRAKLKQSLVSKLEQDVLRKLEAERQRHESLSPESIRISTLREEYDKDVDAQSKVLNLDMELRANGTFFNMADVEQVIKAWSPKLKPGYYLRPETIKASKPIVVAAEGGLAKIEVDVQGVVSSRINEDRVTESIRWKTPEEVVRYLDTLVLAKEPEVIVEPGWASRALRVQIVVLNPDGTATTGSP